MAGANAMPTATAPSHTRPVVPAPLNASSVADDSASAPRAKNWSR